MSEHCSRQLRQPEGPIPADKYLRSLKEFRERQSGPGSFDEDLERQMLQFERLRELGGESLIPIVEI